MRLVKKIYFSCIQENTFWADEIKLIIFYKKGEKSEDWKCYSEFNREYFFDVEEMNIFWSFCKIIPPCNLWKNEKNTWVVQNEKKY